jgi:leader peptidase (prepilin peptidase)/N-methyltransferase
MTGPLADTVIAHDRVGARPAAPSLSDAWRRSTWAWRAAAIAAALCGPAMALAGHVPAASGTAVAVLVPAALIDVHHRRLPNRWVGAAAVCFVVVALAGAAHGEPIDATGALAGAGLLIAPMLALHLLSPASMGFGDVKAGAVLGACLGALDWRLALAGLALAAGLTSCVAIARGRSEVAFGPGLVVGALIALGAHTTFRAPAPASSSGIPQPVVASPLVHLRPDHGAQP